jgi:hypothetical protein
MMNIGPAVETILRRVRQSGSIAFSEDTATQLLTICQQILNIALRRVFVSETLTTKKEKLVYSISSDLTNAVDIVSIVEGNRELLMCQSLAEFDAIETNWFRNITATRFEAWHQPSRDLFIIYPGKAANSSVTIESVKATTVYSDFSTYYNTALEFNEEDYETLFRLTELIILASARKPKPFTSTFEIFKRLMEAKNVIL